VAPVGVRDLALLLASKVEGNDDVAAIASSRVAAVRLQEGGRAAAKARARGHPNKGHVRALGGVSGDGGARLLYAQLYAVNDTTERPFVAMMNTETGSVTKRVVPRDVDLDSLWYHAASDGIFALVLNKTSYYLAAVVDNGDALEFKAMAVPPFRWSTYRGIAYDVQSGCLFVTFARYSATLDTTTIVQIDVLSGRALHQWNLGEWLPSLIQFVPQPP